MGGLFVYKRFYDKENIHIGMHFEKPRSAMEAARVKIVKFNEIMISRKRNNNNNNNNSSSNDHNTSIKTDPSTSFRFEEEEIADLSTLYTNDDTQRLLI